MMDRAVVGERCYDTRNQARAATSDTSASVNTTAPETDVSTDRNASGKAFRQASKGASAAAALWKVGASVVTLLAALFYGIGRLLADGFYTHLNTTASAAGVNTISIIEPAAVLGALVALFATAVLMLLDILQRAFDWVQENAGIIVALVVAATVLATAIALSVIYFEKAKAAFIAFGTAIILQIVLYFFRLVVGGVRARARAKAAKEAEADAVPGAEADAVPGAEADAVPGAEADAVPGAEADAVPGAEADAVPGAVSNLWRVTVVGVTAMVVIGLCIGAHYLGVYEANRVKKGLAVDVSEAGLNISSIGAIPVRLLPIDSSHAIESLSAYNCLLEIGSGASDLIFYDANNHETLSVPASEVVVVSLGGSKKCVGSPTASRHGS
jgi:hypothetical protein